MQKPSASVHWLAYVLQQTYVLVASKYNAKFNVELPGCSTPLLDVASDTPPNTLLAMVGVQIVDAVSTT